MFTPSQELEDLFQPQERFAELHARTIRRFGRRAVDLSYANPYDGPDAEVRAAIRLALDDEKELGFQYTPYGGKTTTRQRIASRLSDEYGLSFEYPDVILTPGAMAALNVTFRALFSTQGEVLVLTPCWLDYPLYLRNLGIPIRLVKLRDDKHLDLSEIEQALSEKTEGVLLSQPCCPTGVLYRQHELDALAALLAHAERRFKKDIYLISDEVHRHIMWSDVVFCSPLLTYPRSLSIYSFGKALFLQGQRIGYVAVSPGMPERVLVRKRLERCVQMMGFCAPTTLMQRAITRLLDYKPSLDVIASRQETMRGRLKAYGYDVCDGEGTFFIYAKSPVVSDYQFIEHMASQGVLVLPSTLFHERGYFRISVTARHESMMSALDVFGRVFDTLHGAVHAHLLSLPTSQICRDGGK